MNKDLPALQQPKFSDDAFRELRRAAETKTSGVGLVSSDANGRIFAIVLPATIGKSE